MTVDSLSVFSAGVETYVVPAVVVLGLLAHRRIAAFVGLH